jgi:hypothetical protein
MAIYLFPQCTNYLQDQYVQSGACMALVGGRTEMFTALDSVQLTHCSFSDTNCKTLVGCTNSTDGTCSLADDVIYKWPAPAATYVQVLNYGFPSCSPESLRTGPVFFPNGMCAANSGGGYIWTISSDSTSVNQCPYPDTYCTTAPETCTNFLYGQCTSSPNGGYDLATWPTPQPVSTTTSTATAKSSTGRSVSSSGASSSTGNVVPKSSSTGGPGPRPSSTASRGGSTGRSGGCKTKIDYFWVVVVSGLITLFVLL